jgi:Ser/Thr protein kinase RdoA (MazF antagonist)
VAPVALIAAGGESWVYALGSDRILRVLRASQDPAALRRKQAFLGALAGRLPFATSEIETIAPDGSWTIERRIPGMSLLVLLRTLHGREREAALTRYAEAVDAIGAIRFPEHPYGQILAEPATTAATWHDYLRRRLDEFIAANAAAIESHRGGLDALRATALRLLDGVAAMPPKALVHGDYFPGNVIVDGGRVSGLVDFSIWTVVGDPLYDVIGALIFLEMAEEATPGDVALVRRVLRARHGDALDAPAPFYRAYFAFAMADPGNLAGPYPRLWPWALANLDALASGRLAL